MSENWCRNRRGKINTQNHHCKNRYQKICNNFSRSWAHCCTRSAVISVTANVVPEVMHDLCKAALAQQAESAQACNEKIAALHEVLFCESNPIPVKAAMSIMGLMSGEIRLPLTVISDDANAKLSAAMSDLGLLNT